MRAAALLFCAWLASAALPARAEVELQRIQLPEGFSIEVFAEGVEDARSMTLSPSGIVYVGTRRAGNVYAVEDRDGDGKAERTTRIAQGLRAPNGVAWRDGSLYVAEINRVSRLDGIDDKLGDPPSPVVVTDAFPSDVHHGWKFIRFGPDGKLYVPVGAPCNICDPELPYAAIHRVSIDGQESDVFARGVRNSVGFDWHPDTGALWFTDNGRDMLGDDVPPDELNHAPKAGLHFGYPFCHGKNVADPEFSKLRPCGSHTAPARELEAHVAPLGIRFYTGSRFPSQFQKQLFVAEHGSWNRSSPIGYRIMWARIEGDRVTSYEPFASGWLGEDGSAWGRPVDLLNLPDGSLLVSDDRAGVLYRISYAPPGDAKPSAE